MTGTFTVERVYIPAIEQANCLNAIADKETTQKDVASFYADCIRAAGPGMKGVDWAAINAAIVARWPKGSERVKAMAWKELTLRARRALCERQANPEGREDLKG